MPAVIRQRHRPRSRRERKQIRFGFRIVREVNQISTILSQLRGSTVWWCHEECLPKEWEPTFHHFVQSVAALPYRKPVGYTGAYGVSDEKWVEEGAYEQVKQVSSHQISKVSLPKLPFTPENVTKWLGYEKLEEIISPSKVKFPTEPPVRVIKGMSEEAYREVLRQLEVRKMIRWVEREDVIQVNGLYCIPKSGGKLRLIFDGRNVNRWFTEPAKVRLPSGTELSQCTINEEEEVWGFKADLTDFYHQIRLPEWIHTFLGLPPVTTKDGTRWPVLCTLPMGFSYSVLISQHVHETVLQEFAKTLRRGERMYIYIDDVLFQKEGNIRDRDAVQGRTWGLFWSMIEVYRKAGLSVNMKKVEYPSLTTSFLGLAVDGAEGTIQPTAAMKVKTYERTRRLLEMPTLKALESAVGCWVWVLLVHRPWLAILLMTYRNLKAWKAGQTGGLWRSTRRELETLLVCLPIVKARIKGRWSQVEVKIRQQGGRSSSSIWEKGEIKTAKVRQWKFFEKEEILLGRHLMETLETVNTQDLKIVVDSTNAALCCALTKGRTALFPLRRWLLQLLACSVLRNWRVETAGCPFDAVSYVCCRADRGYHGMENETRIGGDYPQSISYIDSSLPRRGG